MPRAQRLAVEPQPAARELVRHGERFQTENDSEVAAAYLTWRTREGDNLKQALEPLAATTSTASTHSSSARATASPCCAIRSPASPPSWPRPTTGSPSAPSIRALAPLPGVEEARDLGAGAGHRLRLEPELLTMARESIGDGRPQRCATPRSTSRDAAARGQPVAARGRRRRLPHQQPARAARHRRRARWRFNVTIDGHVGYYCAGMNKRATVIDQRQRRHRRRREHDVGPRAREGRRFAVGGRHRLRRPADRRRQCVGALRHLAPRPRHRRQGLGRAHVGLHGAGRHLVVLGDAGDALGDSIYEARLYVRGTAKSLAPIASSRTCATRTRRRCASCSMRQESAARSTSRSSAAGSARAKISSPRFHQFPFTDNPAVKV